MEKKMLINVIEEEESRVGILENGALEELYLERTTSGTLVGNVYLGRVTNTLPGIQAAFIDLGLERNGFLHVSDVKEGAVARQRTGRPKQRKPIQDLIKKGQSILAQVTRDRIGDKGPSLTTFISLPGRYLVLMPGVSHYGVSRKITDDEERQKLKKLLVELKPPKGMGFIVRTAGSGRGKRELTQDLNAAVKRWRTIEEKAKHTNPPLLVHQESSLVLRVIRDIFSSDIDSVIIDSEEACKEARRFFQIVAPSYQKRVRLYRGQTPLFHKYGVEKQIESIHQRKVPLTGGGSIVIEQTEALVAIDVNSGRFKGEKDPEETAFATNLRAAPEVARQIRLRDLGGLVLIDFIDMARSRHREEVERALTAAIKRDRSRVKMLRMSKFGIVQMTRQRMRPSLQRWSHESCPHCRGTGQVLTVESMSLHVIRRVRLILPNRDVARIEVTVSTAVSSYLLNRRRRELFDLEDRLKKSVSIRSDPHFGVEKVEMTCYNTDNSPIKVKGAK